MPGTGPLTATSVQGLGGFSMPYSTESVAGLAGWPYPGHPKTMSARLMGGLTGGQNTILIMKNGTNTNCNRTGEPARTKRETIRADKKPPRPKAPNQFWESDVSCMWCGVDGWGYCFSVVDVFTRQWLAFVFSSRATRHGRQWR